MQQDKILILDFGDPAKELLARSIRELGVYSEIKPSHTDIESIKKASYKAIILAEPEEGAAPEADPAIYELGIPVISGIRLQEDGKQRLEKLIRDELACGGTWKMETFVAQEIERIRQQVGSSKVLCALSGGVDSAVSAMMVHKAVGQQLFCIFVDHGCMRKNEGDEVERVFKDFDVNFTRVNAEERFLKKLAGVTDPEEKRKRIGEEFIRVFEEEAEKFKDCDYLVQGTIYPDIIESGIGGAKIKSHHNVGGLPKDIRFKGLVEPLRSLFKNEVREAGLILGLPESMVWRQPFPGPGLAVRCLGEVRKDKLDILRDADAIFREEIKRAGLHKELSQYFAVITNIRSVGVANEGRSYDYTVALRAIKTHDFMTAEWARLPYELLERCSSRIVQEVSGVNRVVYDITSKPPATIEWD